jgi:putative transposase
VYRRRLRLSGYDYASAGAYFVTVCTHRRAALLAVTAHVRSVLACWREIPEHFDVELDAFSVLPDHIHGILFLNGAGHARPLQTVVGSFKSAAAREINRSRRSPGAPVWQRGFDRIIRDESELAALREYVVGNPDARSADPTKRARAGTSAAAPWL